MRRELLIEWVASDGPCDSFALEEDEVLTYPEGVPTVALVVVPDTPGVRAIFTGFASIHVVEVNDAD